MMSKRLLSFLLLLQVTWPVLAFDFSVEMAEGYSLYFNIVDDEEYTASLTCPSTGSGYWQGYTMPSGVLNIPAEVSHDGTFYTVVAVGDRAFSGCSNISALNLPPTITEIGAYAFYKCTGIRGVFTIGEAVTAIGKSAFFGCTGITELRFNAVACEIMGGSRSGVAFAGCRSLTKVVFSPRVTLIPDFAFMGMDQLNQEWQLPHDLEQVGEYAFANCTGIHGTLVLPAALQRVGPCAFYKCNGISQVELPSHIQRIDQRAFYQCINLKQVICNSFVPATVGAEAFAGLHATVTLQVPCISVDSYRAADGWKRLRKINAIEPCMLELVATATDPAYGFVMGAGVYPVGDTVQLTAVCNAGYGFLRWSDGNTDNPRSIIINDTTAYQAVMQPYEVLHEVEYIHDTIYTEGTEVVYEYYEINDVAELLSTQSAVVYNKEKRRLEIGIDKSELVSVSLYNDVGVCVTTGVPRRGYIKMKRYPTGAYIVRLMTEDNEMAFRFFHEKK